MKLNHDEPQSEDSESAGTFAASLILLVLILWRGRSPEFRRRSEYPKFRFLANLGLKVRGSARNEPELEGSDRQGTNPTPKEQHEDHEP